jgi:hypothetical protein
MPTLLGSLERANFYHSNSFSSTSSFRNAVIPIYLEFGTMNKVQMPSYSEIISLWCIRIRNTCLHGCFRDSIFTLRHPTETSKPQILNFQKLFCCLLYRLAKSNISISVAAT